MLANLCMISVKSSIILLKAHVRCIDKINRILIKDL